METSSASKIKMAKSSPDLRAYWKHSRQKPSIEHFLHPDLPACLRLAVAQVSTSSTRLRTRPSPPGTGDAAECRRCGSPEHREMGVNGKSENRNRRYPGESAGRAL